MPSRQKTEQPLSPEPDAIAAAAADRLRAQCGDDPRSADEHSQRVADAASAAIRAGTALSAIADAERVGEERARTDYDHAIDRAARLGLSHREIATAATVSHGTIRAVLARTETQAGDVQPAGDEPGDREPDADPGTGTLAA